MHPTLGDAKSLEPGCHKVNSRCFWNACKALTFGIFLMIVGTTMATLGYYAEQLSEDRVMRGNVTVRVKHETRGFHLNNLSYAGPIVMGFGGFIVVAACVMTFEARDSAAKVVPSRNKYSSCRSVKGSVRHTSVRSEVRGGPVESPDRRQLTQAFLQFSRRLEMERGKSELLTKSPSAPDLQATDKMDLSPPVNTRRISPRVKRSSRNSLHPTTALLSPHALLHRQALSVDNPDYMGYYSPPKGSRDLSHSYHENRGSQASMVMDIHVSGEGPTTIRVKDRRSELARRNVFTRQRPVVDEEDLVESLRRETSSVSPRLPSYYLPMGDELGSHRSRSTPHSRRQSIAYAHSRGGSAEEYPSQLEGSPGRRASSATCSRRTSMRRHDSRRASGDSRRADSRRPSGDSRRADSRRASGDSSRQHAESRRSSGESRRRASYYSKSGTSSQDTTSTRVPSLATPESTPSTSTLMPPQPTAN